MSTKTYNPNRELIRVRNGPGGSKGALFLINWLEFIADPMTQGPYKRIVRKHSFVSCL